MPGQGPARGGVVADAGEYLADGRDAVGREPVEVGGDGGAGLVRGLDVHGLFLDHGGLLDVDDLEGRTRVVGEPSRGVDDGGGPVVGADGDDERRPVGGSRGADRRERGRDGFAPARRLFGPAEQTVAARQYRDGHDEGPGAQVERHAEVGRVGEAVAT